jgi:hypothetical protein
MTTDIGPGRGMMRLELFGVCQHASCCIYVPPPILLMPVDKETSA